MTIRHQCKIIKHLTWEITLHVAETANTEMLQNHTP
jgi:hypothetical protein